MDSLKVPVLSQKKVRELYLRKQCSGKAPKQKPIQVVKDKKSLSSMRVDKHVEQDTEQDVPQDVNTAKYQMGFSHFREKSQKLDQKLDLQKNLVNMVIHDLRCPTAQIKYSADNLQLAIRDLKASLDDIRSDLEFENQIIDSLEEALPIQLLEKSSPAVGVEKMIADLRTLLPSLPRAANHLGRSFVKQLETISDKKRRSRTPLQPLESSFFAGSPAITIEELDSSSSSSSSSSRLSSESEEDQANADIEPTVPGLETLISKMTSADPPKFIEEVTSRQPSNLSFSSCCKVAQSLPADPQSNSLLLQLPQEEEEPALIHEQIDSLRECLYSQNSHLDHIAKCLDKIQQGTNSCESSSAILLNLINDLLDFAKAENGSFAFSNDFFDLEAELLKAKQTLDFMATQKQIETELRFRESEQADKLRAVFGDSGRLKQVIVNLMSNALKFTDAGGKVSVHVDIEETSSSVADIDAKSGFTEEDSFKLKSNNALSKSIVRIEVRDNGLGISEEGQQKLFKNFSCLSEHKALNKRGTGLGLCICKQIISKMGGTISVESKVNEGTTFILVIPFLGQDPPEILVEQLEPCEEGATLSDLSVAKRQSLNLSLSSKIPSRTRIKNEDSFESLSGLQLRRVKMSASPKNFQFRKRLSILSYSRIDRTPDVQSSIGTLDDRWNYLRVLVVNDEPVSLMILEQMFRDQLGTRVQTAPNGQAAIDKARDSYFDLIVMDLHMPVLDGFEATRQIRAGVLNQKSVVVALSASTFTEDLKKQCREAGFSCWLTSPVMLRSVITEVLEKHLSDF